MQALKSKDEKLIVSVKQAIETAFSARGQNSNFRLATLFFVADKAETKLSALASRASEPLRKLDHGGFD